MSASALRSPQTKWIATAPWNKGRIWPVAGHIRVSADVTITPALFTNSNTFFAATVNSNSFPDW